MLSRLLSHDLWGSREFRALVAGNTVERFAASALTVMLAFHVYHVRNSPLDLALLGSVQVVPALTLALYGGDVADCHSRRRLVLTTIAVLTVLCGALVVVSVTGLWLLAMLLAAALLAANARA